MSALFSILMLLFLFLSPLFCIPLDADVYVRGYYRKDGTYVRPHYRSSPDGNPYNNWSTKGNINPYTKEIGTKYPNTSSPLAISPPSTYSQSPIYSESPTHSQSSGESRFLADFISIYPTHKAVNEIAQSVESLLKELKDERVALDKIPQTSQADAAFLVMLRDYVNLRKSLIESGFTFKNAGLTENEQKLLLVVLDLQEQVRALDEEIHRLNDALRSKGDRNSTEEDSALQKNDESSEGDHKSPPRFLLFKRP